MADEEKNLEEWLAEEQARLDKGFTIEPKHGSGTGKPGAGEEILAGLGLGAGVVGGALAPHPNPVTFEGVKATVIVSALKSEIADDDTRAKVDRTGDSVVVTLLQSQADAPRQFSPALTATLIETADTLTITLGDLNQDVKRGAISSMGSTLVEQGKRALSGRRSLAGLLDAAGNVIEGVDDLVENVQDLGLPRRVWEVIDRVGEAAEEVYLEERRKEQELQRRREEAVRAWTHCPSCGRAYRDDETDRVDCPACGAPRGDKPA